MIKISIIGHALAITHPYATVAVHPRPPVVSHPIAMTAIYATLSVPSSYKNYRVV